MTGELSSRFGVDSRPTRSNQHHQLLGSSKVDEIEILESGGCGGGGNHHDTKLSAGWICCMPCVWLRTSATMHKIAITTATLLVTSLLVASPVLFLLSTAPSQLPKDCNTKTDLNCLSMRTQIPECTTLACYNATIDIQSRLNWKTDPCKDFRGFSNSQTKPNIKLMKGAQEQVDELMQQIFQHNLTKGPFQKMGKLYESCLRQTINSTSLHYHLNKVGMYMPMSVSGPTTITGLLLKISEYGPTPLVAMYYDLSYGRKPQSMLIIDSSMESSPILQNTIRWMGPKSAPFEIRYDIPPLLNDLINEFLPNSLDADKREYERNAITDFVRELNQLRRESLRKRFSDSSVLYNVSVLTSTYPFLYWEDLIVPSNWSGPILIRSGSYLKNIQQIIQKYSTRVVHNAVVLLYALEILPKNTPNPLICTKATIWAMPEVSSALYTMHFNDKFINNAIERAESLFEVLKAHLKRAPSLKGAALVKLSQLKIQAQNWPLLGNLTEMNNYLDNIEITSDNWFNNIITIYKNHKALPKHFDLFTNEGLPLAWAYPIIAKPFYDTLSHSIVIPLSVILDPYFDAALPQYLHYASVGVLIGKEIFRSITKAFEPKVIRCVPSSVNVFPNASRMKLLLHSGGMQMSYHSLLTLAGPMKGMIRMPNMNLTPTQLFFVVTAQQLCANSNYAGANTNSEQFGDILQWLIAQGGNAPNAFHCSHSSSLYSQKTCNVL